MIKGDIRISDRDKRIVCLWLAGWKGEAIAAELGTWRGAIHRRRIALGLPARLPGKNGSSRPVNLFPFIVAWARAGYSAHDIARGIGCENPDLIARIDT